MGRGLRGPSAPSLNAGLLLLLLRSAAAASAAAATGAVAVQRGPGVGGGAGAAHEARPAARAAWPPPQHRVCERVSGVKALQEQVRTQSLGQLGQAVAQPQHDAWKQGSGYI